MDTPHNALEQQKLELEPQNEQPADESADNGAALQDSHLHELFERLNDHQDEDGPALDEQQYLAAEQSDAEAYAAYAAMQMDIEPDEQDEQDEQDEPDASVEEPEITDGMQFLESGASLSSYVDRYRAAMAAESERRFQAAQEGAGSDHGADEHAANLDARGPARSMADGDHGQQAGNGGFHPVHGPSVGAALGAIAALGAKGLTQLAASLSKAGDNIAQTVAGHSYQRAERALHGVLSEADQNIALLREMGLKDVANADPDNKPSLRTAFLAKEGAKELIDALSVNLDQAETLASSMIKKAQYAGLAPDRVMHASLGAVGDFAKRHKELLDEIHDRNGKSFSERLEGMATGLLTFLKTLAMSLANRLNANTGAPTAAAPRMG